MDLANVILYITINDLGEGIDVTESNNINECTVHYYWYFNLCIRLQFVNTLFIIRLRSNISMRHVVIIN